MQESRGASRLPAAAHRPAARYTAERGVVQQARPLRLHLESAASSAPGMGVACDRNPTQLPGADEAAPSRNLYGSTAMTLSAVFFFAVVNTDAQHLPLSRLTSCAVIGKVADSGAMPVAAPFALARIAPAFALTLIF